MEIDWESKIHEWLSDESPRYLGKVWQVLVELEDERKFLGNRFKIPLHRKRFEKGKPLEGTIRTLYSLVIKGFIQIDKRPLAVSEIDIFRKPETVIELTNGFKFLYDWLKQRVSQKDPKTVIESTGNPHNKKPIWNIEKNKGAVLVLPNGTKLRFWGGVFGGLNILFKNFGKEITRSQLRAEIYNNLQQKKKSSKNAINISAWITDLKRKRKLFFVYFNIERYNPDFYSLVWVSR